MSEQTSIQWTGATYNPWSGCIKISQGCAKCYMYRDKERYGQDPRAIRRSKPATFNAPLRWQREVERGQRTGQGRLVFTCSWSDWFIAEADAWRDEAWEIVRRCPDLIFQVLTKRPERIRDHLPPDWGAGWPHVWLGVSVEDQVNADRRIPVLLEVPAAVRFLSCEPLLSEIDLARSFPCGYYCDESAGHVDHPFAPESLGNSGGGGIRWVIVGGESGYTTGKYASRPCHVDWIRALVAQCRAAGVPCHVKQLGSAPVGVPRLRDSHGGDPSEWPADLRVREFPLALETT